MLSLDRTAGEPGNIKREGLGTALAVFLASDISTVYKSVLQTIDQRT